MPADQITATAPAPAQADEAESIGPWARFKYWAIRAFLWGWARCFSLKGLYLLGQVFGTCEYVVNHKRRRKNRQRLAVIFGEQLTDGLARRATWRHFMRIRCDKLFYLIFDKLPREKILNRVRFVGREKLDEALKRGHGAQILTSHYGSQHVAGLLLALLGYKVAGVRDRKEAPLRKYVQEKYAETFPEFRDFRVFFADSFPRELYRALEEGFILGSSLDIEHERGAHLRTTTVSIFGEQREFLNGPVRIALRCSSPILQAFLISRRNFYYRFVMVGPLIDPAQSHDDAETLQRAMQLYADNVQDFVRRYPCHIAKT
jgi:lauroyl/myristoyl acyltransferase